MISTGILKVDSGVSRLSGTRLARQGEADPFGAATNFLANRGLDNNDFIFVDGSSGFVGNVPVIFITDAGFATPTIGFAVPTIVGVAATKAIPRGSKKATTRAARKSGTKGKKSRGSTSGKKSAGKKTGKRSRKG